MYFYKAEFQHFIVNGQEFGSPLKRLPMGDSNRRDFLRQLFTPSSVKDAFYNINQDELFKKYSNKQSPLGFKRKRAGLSQYTGPWTNEQKLHLLRRTMFGVSP
ncbi:MAG TPA: hypothetical protein DCF44_09770, partial [Chitinophagaceae bacterium]|nr:hypothetical protein [Chitinophagaceae bacterium]